MIFTLNLSHEITYKEETIYFDTIEGLDIGSETCFCYHFYFDDVCLRTDLIWSGSKKPLTKKEKDIIESGFPPLPRDDENLFIPVGRYSLLQTLPVSDKSKLTRVILPFTSKKQEGKLYVRFIKENVLECVMQLFFPE